MPRRRQAGQAIHNLDDIGDSLPESATLRSLLEVQLVPPQTTKVGFISLQKQLLSLKAQVSRAFVYTHENVTPLGDVDLRVQLPRRTCNTRRELMLTPTQNQVPIDIPMM